MDLNFIIRLQCSDISILGRITSGVKLMNVTDNIKVASVAKVREKKEPDNAENADETDIIDGEYVEADVVETDETKSNESSDFIDTETAEVEAVDDDSLNRLLERAAESQQEDLDDGKE